MAMSKQVTQMIIEENKQKFEENKQKFEEMFPGLAKLEMGLMTRGEISRYCLGKQRVREAVMRLPNDNRKYILLKELGLEE
jgi:hypothetical protein